MAISAKRCKIIWDDLIKEHYFKKRSYTDEIGKKLLRVRFLKDGGFKPCRSSEYALTKHRALVAIYRSRLQEERIRMNRGQRELPF